MTTQPYQLPAFSFDPSRVWTEVPSAPQSTTDVARAVSALTMLTSYMLAGHRLRGSYEDFNLDELDTELNKFCKWHGLSATRIIDWAESLLLPVTFQKKLGVMVESRMDRLGFALHGYQRDTAEWMASRKGGVLALSCGTGKSVTAWAAVKAAVRNEQCSDSRCHIICPVNAVSQWIPYAEDLQSEFKEVLILSVDSTHKYRHLPKIGGAMIIDECFPAHTRVMTEFGEVTFGELAGMHKLPRVLTRDSQGKEYLKYPVKLVRNPNTRGLVRVWFGDRHVDCTPDHPVWTEEDGYVKAAMLRVGHHHLRVLRPSCEGTVTQSSAEGPKVLRQALLSEVEESHSGSPGPHVAQTSSGSEIRCDGGVCSKVVRVDCIEILEHAGGGSRYGDEVYCLEVEGTHCFYADGVLVHNCHKVKNETSARAINTFQMRLGYDWCACLTGTLLHTGPEGVLAIQDTAIPGLSRFADKWRFGEVFDCIVRKKVGSRTRSALAMPSGENFDKFVTYLARGTKSLSFASPEVRESNLLPGQTKHTIDTWPEPQWVRDLRKQDRAEITDRLQAVTGRKPLPSEVDNEEKFFWLPNCNWRWGLAVTGVAIMHEIADLRAVGLDVDREPIQKQLTIGGAPEEDEIGLPTFAKVRMEASREGRIDRCIERFKESDGSVTYKWRYAPGTTFINPGPGPKIQEVLRWVDANKGEPALIGSSSSLAKQLVAAELTKRGLKFGLIDGTVPAKERGRLAKAFQDGDIDYMVVQQVAGSESITLTRAANSFLIDHSWSPIFYTQYLARTCRTSQTRECEHYDLVFGALQAEIVRTLQRGEAFDVRVRTQLEEMMRASTTALNAGSLAPSL